MSTTFANSIDNNLIYADRAEHDAAGNDLQTTYATKAELPEFSQAEQDAMDSGINSTKVGNYDNHLADTTIHVTSADKTAWNGKQDAINDLSTIRSGAQAGSTAVQPGDLATVAVSGDYDDLLNKPVIPTVPVQDVTVDGTSVLNSQGVAEITMPTIPVTDVEVDGTSVLNAQGVAEITMPTFTQAQANWTESDNQSVQYIQNKPTLAAVATSGAYSDLSGTPTINNVPAVTSSDDNKVLKASYSGGVGSYSWETESGGTVTDVEVDGTSVVSAGVASITMPTELVPTVTSSDDGKVLKAAYSGGTGSYSWETESGGGGADWDAQSGEPGYIENKPVPKTLVAGTGITITENSTQLVVASTSASYSAGNGLTLNNTTFAVDTSVVATQNDLSGYATTQDLGGKQDTLTAGANISIDANNEISATDTTYTAGEGISISNQNVISSGYNETLLWSSSTAASSFTLSETITNFERLKILMKYNGMSSWCDGTIVSAAQFTVACCGYANSSADGNRLQIFGGSFTSSNGTTFTSEAGKCIYFANGSASIGGGVTAACAFLKIYGVNRIASN